MEIRVGHYPYVIYGPYVTHIKDQTPGILVGIDRRKQVREPLVVNYAGVKYACNETPYVPWWVVNYDIEA